jgi:hypothetical protein
MVTRSNAPMCSLGERVIGFYSRTRAQAAIAARVV